MVPVPSVGQMIAEAEGLPSEVTEQPAMEAIPLPTSERTELSLALMVPTAVGVTPLVEAPLTQREVAVTVTSQAQPNIAAVVPEDAARSAPPAAQVVTPLVFSFHICTCIS